MHKTGNLRDFISEQKGVGNYHDFEKSVLLTRHGFKGAAAAVVDVAGLVCVSIGLYHETTYLR